MHINLKNERTGQVKQAKVGFSWTMFFWGFLVPLVRGDWKWCVILLVIEVVLGIPTFGFGVGITGIVFSFVYNRLYINDLINNGYTAADEFSRQTLQSHNFTM